MAFYHATDCVIDWPNIQTWGQHSHAKIEGVPIVGLFANSKPLSVYGDVMYRLTLKANTKTLTLSNKMYDLMRLDHGYRAGLFDTARRAGHDALTRKHPEGDTSLIVLKFKVIETWVRVDG